MCILSYNGNGININDYVRSQEHSHGKIEIGEDVWIGSGVSILINSFIEDGAVISTNSVVSGELPAFSVCAGIPAKVIKYRS